MRSKSWDNKGSEISGEEEIQKRPKLFSNKASPRHFFGEHPDHHGSAAQRKNNIISPSLSV